MYNTFAIKIKNIIEKEGITNNTQFSTNPKTANAYEAYLLFNSIVQVILQATLIVSVCLMVSRLRKFFKEQFRSETKALVGVTVTILISGLLQAFFDIFQTILQMRDEPFSEDVADTMILGSLILFFPILVFNIMHFSNVRASKRNTVEDELKQSFSTPHASGREQLTIVSE